jgi:hypothetical protein
MKLAHAFFPAVLLATGCAVAPPPPGGGIPARSGPGVQPPIVESLPDTPGGDPRGLDKPFRVPGTRNAQPAMIVERPGKAPGSEYRWNPGMWIWTGQDWLWNPGSWQVQ